jgi:hypothetical protein
MFAFMLKYQEFLVFQKADFGAIRLVEYKEVQNLSPRIFSTVQLVAKSDTFRESIMLREKKFIPAKIKWTIIN